MGFLIIVCDGGGARIVLVIESPNKKRGARTSFNESKSVKLINGLVLISLVES